MTYENQLVTKYIATGVSNHQREKQQLNLSITC